MKLYLSSYHFGDQPEKMHELVSGPKMIGKERPTVGIILNAGDIHTPEENMLRYEQDAESFIGMGFDPALLDLKVFFDPENKDKLRDVLSELDMVWVRGGNVFTLRRAMRQSGFDAIITGMVHHNDIVYAGYSAGAVVATPTLRGIELVDGPSDLPADMGYDADIIWEGLNFVPYSIAPHYKSDHPETAAIDTVVEYFEREHMPYRALRDNEVIIVNE